MVRVRYSNELYHHGIMGQKWGVRRFQNEDGSLTPEGRERYGVGEGGISRHNTSRNIRKVAGKYAKNVLGAGAGGAAVGAGIGAAALGIPTAGVGAGAGALAGAMYCGAAGLGAGFLNADIGSAKYLYKQIRSDARKKHDRYKNNQMSKDDRRSYESQLKARRAVKQKIETAAPWASAWVYDDYLDK